MSTKKSSTLHVVSSSEPPRWLWDHFHSLNHLSSFPLTHLEYRVAVVLLQHANQAAQCYPSVRRIARICQCSVRGVTMALASLEDKHAIAINHGKRQRRVNRYVLTFALHAPAP